MTWSTGIRLVMPARAISAAASALTAPPTFLLTQGTSTRPATGSHTRPIRFLSAMAAAWPMVSASAPFTWQMAAAAIAEPEPISAWQPPAAPARKARLAMTWPTPAATYMASTIFSSDTSYSLKKGTSTAGSTPHAPAVGAAMIRFIQALLHPIFRATVITFAIKSPQRVSPFFWYSSMRPPSFPTRPLLEMRSGS